MKILITTFLVILATSALAGKLKITTNEKDVEIFARPTKTRDFKKIGKLPFEKDIQELVSEYTGSEVFVIELRKKGFKNNKTLMSAISKTDVDLYVEMERDDKFKDHQLVDELVSDLFEAQRLIRSKNYDQALKVLEVVDKKHPELSVSKELTASTYYIQKDYKNALDFFKQAYVKNPKNLDAYKMIVYLEKAMGVEKPLK